MSQPELYYSSCNEDLDAELSGLEIRPGDRVLAVSGGGGRAIGLLLADPGQVVAIDSNSAQCHLVELKKAAFLGLDHRQLLTFLGIGEGVERQRRLDLWPRVEAGLEPAAREFWRGQLDLIGDGILFAGMYERQLRQVATGLRWLFGRELEELFSCTDLEQQRRIWGRLRGRRTWRWVFGLWTHPYWYRFFFRRYGWFRNAPEGVRLSRVAADRLDRLLERRLARDSHILQIKLCGHYFPGAALPNYLRPEHYAEIRARLDRLEVVQASLFDQLEDPALEPFDRFSLSNVPNYLFAEDFARLWRVLVRASRPGARVVYRQVLFDRGLPPGLAGVRRLPAVEGVMRDVDKGLIYHLSGFEIQG